MKDRVIFITAIEEPEALPHKEFCFHTWRWWAGKNGARLHILDRPVTSVVAMKPHWQKIYAFKVLDDLGVDYDRIALVDADTMVRWDCPDFFELSGDEFSATVDHDCLGWIHESLLGYRHLFPGTEISWMEYFNSGFLVLSRAHRRLFCDILRFYLDHCRELLTLEDSLGVPGLDQTPLNFLVRRLGFKVNYLPKAYNLTQMNGRSILENGYYVDLGYIWHFNGLDPSSRLRFMAECWERIRGHYPPKPSAAGGRSAPPGEGT